MADLPIFSGEPTAFPKFLTLFETRLNILTAPKCYEYNCIDKPTANQTDAFQGYLETFKVNSLKASLGEHLQDIVSSIPEKQMEKFEDFKQALNDYFLPKRNLLHCICKFSNAQQREGETLQNFLSKFQRLRAEADLNNLNYMEI